MSLKKKDRDAIANLVSEMYDNEEIIQVDDSEEVEPILEEYSMDIFGKKSHKQVED